jgi:hypothetical protein
MIVTQLVGGLGNQMFQYAVGRALAIKHNTSLKLDTSPFAGYALRAYALARFAIEASELTDGERRDLGLDRAPAGRVGRLLQRLRPPSRTPVIKERGFSFDPSVLDAPATCHLQGYWQSPKYFAAIERDIRREFTVREPLAGANLDASRQMENGTAVSLHVRRGDYVANPHTNRYHGTCDADYYTAAEALLRKRVGRFRIFVFSDDPEWAQANLRLASPMTVLRHNGPAQDYEDLRLMTLCRHHIIANSTFSWWGAWLCTQPGKLVVAPRNWFRDPEIDTTDLMPDDWVRL